MKMMKCLAGMGVMLGVMVGVVMCGCESTKTTENAMTVTPGEATVTHDSALVTFTASLTSSNSSLILPLEWSVSDPSMGHIRSSSGVTAVYEATSRHGNNTVLVRDQGDAEGVAAVMRE
jgi:hypothetical protein